MMAGYPDIALKSLVLSCLIAIFYSSRALEACLSHMQSTFVLKFKLSLLLRASYCSRISAPNISLLMHGHVHFS
ncbi:hypothetical protein BX666DRAFT_1260534 [Dichotomocladium elegans]|nr:hypothetical protein BX666DRAFT_1260534 [Dichotomocladium elegans]